MSPSFAATTLPRATNFQLMISNACAQANRSGGRHVKTLVSECATLREYRREILKVPQAEIAHNAKCHPAWISQVELGHLPQPWRRDALLKAYELTDQPQEFERMVLGAKRLRAMKKPISETEPLLASAANNARVVKAVLNEGWQDLSESEITLLATYRQMKAKQA